MIDRLKEYFSIAFEYRHGTRPAAKAVAAYEMEKLRDQLSPTSRLYRQVNNFLKSIEKEPEAIGG